MIEISTDTLKLTVYNIFWRSIYCLFANIQLPPNLETWYYCKVFFKSLDFLLERIQRWSRSLCRKSYICKTLALTEKLNHPVNWLTLYNKCFYYRFYCRAFQRIWMDKATLQLYLQQSKPLNKCVSLQQWN